MNPAPNSGSVVKDFIQASTNSITSVNTSFIMSIILGSLFDDNNVTFEYDSHTSWAWVKLVLSQVKIGVNNRAKDVSGFNNVISLKPRLIGLPPSWLASPILFRDVYLSVGKRRNYYNY